MRARVLSRVGTLVVIAFVVWRLVGGPGAGGGGDEAAAGATVAAELDRVTEQLRGRGGSGGPGVYPVDPADSAGQAPATTEVTVFRGR